MSLGRNRSPLRVAALAVVALAATALVLGASAALGASANGVETDGPAGPAGESTGPQGTRVIVQWTDDSDRAERVAAREDAEVRYSTELGDPSFQLVTTRGGQNAAEAAAALESDPAVAIAEPDSLLHLEAVPNDPLFGQEWGLQNTGQAVNNLPPGQVGNDTDVVPAWNRTVGTPSTVVADIDSGYRFDSPDLEKVAWTNPGEIPGNGIDDDHNGYIDDVHGWDFVGEDVEAPVEDNDPSDSDVISGGHGVHTAGTIGAAGNNGVGISGVAQNVRIMPLRVCSNDPAKNQGGCAESALIAAINYAGANGARVANLSLGGTERNQAEVNALAANPGTLYVISAGNDSANNDSGGTGKQGHHYPCDYKPATESDPVVPGAIENVICVAALDPSGALASYSDYGPESVDLGAPGSSVLSTYPVSETLFSDNFETDDFATKWTTLGSGFARTNESPLTSFGMTDTPGAPPAANAVYGVETTAGFAVPEGAGACRVEGSRYRKGGTMPYGLIVSGGATESFNGGETAGSAMARFGSPPMANLGGSTVHPFFEYHAGAAPTIAEGLWLDDIALRCNAPYSTPPTYSFLDGTSMAAPHVSGAAALLFSLKPTATVTQVRNAILDTTTPMPSLNGKTVTGGRLNVSAALNQLVPPGTETTAPDTELQTTTPALTAATPAKFHLRRLDADGGTFECRLGAEAFHACGNEIEVFPTSGPHTLEARAKNEAGIVDPTPASFTWTVDATPPSLSITEGPTGPTTQTGATFEFTASDANPPVTTECSLDGAAYSACTSPETYGSLGVGEHEFNVRAKDVVGNHTNAFWAWTIVAPSSGGGSGEGGFKQSEEQVIKANPPGTPVAPPAPNASANACTVPNLVGKTLGRAKTALRAAGCKLGKVTAPKVRHSTWPSRLVVRSSSPAAGATTHGRVALRLGPKQKPKRRHH